MSTAWRRGHDQGLTVRWGVAGPGPVAEKVLRDLPHVPNAVLTAVGSRSAERAEAFAAAHAASAGHGQVPTAHGSYRALLGDPDVDVIYVATPHPQHRAIALAALAAGKAILVEKSFTVTPEATREIVAAACAAGRFAMEAMWTRFQPGRGPAARTDRRRCARRGALGAGELGCSQPVDPATPSSTPSGVRRGVPPVCLPDLVRPDGAGHPGRRPHGVVHATGVDLEESMLLGFPGGRTASLFCSLRCASPGQMRIYGTDGWIDVLPRFHHPDTIVVHRLRPSRRRSSRRAPAAGTRTS